MSEIASKQLIEAIAEQDAVFMLSQGLTEMPNRYPAMTAAAIHWKLGFQAALRRGTADDERGR